ncbi:MAG: 50S ribosomal protein L10 [Candidatus Helarchaeota archaeon]|nr:50S ribosomal protein L10 [Candidatus Helarchaeota archaeon]
MATDSKHVPQFKLEEVQMLKKLLDEYNVICMARMHKLGARQLQSIRKKLTGQIVIRMTKNKLFKIAAFQSKKKNIKEFIDKIEGSTSYIFTQMNPFNLKIFLDKNKVNAPAKGGDIAQKDIIVPQGNTGFPPGPLISEFKEVGIDSMVKGGSIYIKRDCVVVKKGEEISRILALTLSRLNISPMEIGLNLYASYDNGVILEEKDLDISLDRILYQIRTAIGNALSLSVGIAYPTRENIPILLQKAYMNAKTIVIKAGIITKDTVPDILAVAKAHALSLSNLILQVDPKALPSDLKQQIEESGPAELKPTEPEKKKEEVKEEEKTEDLGFGSLFD